jgi:glutamyl-tRNA reductase
MALVALGVDHHATPLAERERLAYSPAALARLLPRLRSAVPLDECVVVSTCNRTELYGACGHLTGAFERMQAFLAADRRLPPDWIDGRAFRLHDDAAARHLFRVASGLESMVLGEGQVLGQVRSGFSAARRAGTLGPELEALGRYAIACGRRARTETLIGRAPVSFAQAAVALARQEHRELARARLVVIGTGTMAQRVITWFKHSGVEEVTVLSRTFARAAALAARRGLRAVPMSRLREALAQSDIVVVATTASAPLLTASVLPHRRRNPLSIVDLGVPRGVARGVAETPGVHLHDLDDLQRTVSAAQVSRRTEVAQVESIVEEETARYLAWQRARHVAPAIAELHAHAESVRAGELARFERQLERLPAAQRQAVASLTRSIVNKLLHTPVVRLKDYAQGPHGAAYVDVVRSLFGFEAPPATAEARRTGAGKAGRR